MFRYQIFRPRLPYLTLNSTSLPLPFLNLRKKPRTFLPLSLYQSIRPTHELSTHSDLPSIIWAYYSCFRHQCGKMGQNCTLTTVFFVCFCFFNIEQHIKNKPTVERWPLLTLWSNLLVLLSQWTHLVTTRRQLSVFFQNLHFTITF